MTHENSGVGTSAPMRVLTVGGALHVGQGHMGTLCFL